MQATASISSSDHLRAERRDAAEVVTSPKPLPGAAPAAPKVSLSRFVGPYAWSHRWALLACFLLNALPGVAIALQTMMPGYMLDNILKVTGFSVKEKYLRDRKSVV